MVSPDNDVTENTGEVFAGTLAYSGNFDIQFESLKLNVDMGNSLKIIPGINAYASAYPLTGCIKMVTPVLSQIHPITIYTIAKWEPILKKGSLICVPDCCFRMAEQTTTDDAALLIKHLTTGEAFVFGSSSGALVSLELITRHPEIIKALVAHEPTALKYLPDTEKWQKTIQDIFDLYEQEGGTAAKKKFVNELIPGQKDGQLMQGKGDETSPNEAYWFAHEVRQYPSTDFDTAKLEAKDKILFCVGRDSIHTMPAWPVTNLAKDFDTEVLSVPGGHLGYLLHPAEFVEDLLAGLKKRNKL